MKLTPIPSKHTLRLANVYILKGEIDKALANFEKVLSLSPNDWRASKGIGYIYLVRGELAKASGWLNMAGEGNEEDLSIHFWLALVYHEKGLVTEMDREIEKVRAICQNIEKFTAKPGFVTSYVLGKIAVPSRKIQGSNQDTLRI